ncbi:MAG: hypothetical protein V4568_16085 [Pseudomonadota bacterium]
MIKLSVLFFSHGSPLRPIEGISARRLGKTTLSPKTIEVFLAHWESIAAPAT